MMEAITKIIQNILTAFYKPFGFAVVLSVLFMFLCMYAGEQGWKAIFKKWLDCFKTSAIFRRRLLLVFFTVMILFRTLFARDLWSNPLSDVMGGWGIKNSEGKLVTDSIENILLFMPFTALLLYSYKKKLVGANPGFLRVLCISAKISFVFSTGVELAQLLLHIGTFQFSDITYNTLGGILGGGLYWVFARLRGILKTRKNKRNPS